MSKRKRETISFKDKKPPDLNVDMAATVGNNLSVNDQQQSIIDYFRFRPSVDLMIANDNLRNSQIDWLKPQNQTFPEEVKRIRSYLQYHHDLLNSARKRYDYDRSDTDRYLHMLRQLDNYEEIRSQYNPYLKEVIDENLEEYNLAMNQKKSAAILRSIFPDMQLPEVEDSLANALTLADGRSQYDNFFPSYKA